MFATLTATLERLRLWLAVRNRSLLPIVFAETAPLDLRIVGRTLFHSALVGVAAGFVGALFFGALEYMQRFLLEDLAGYVVLRAHGETFAAPEQHHDFQPWLLAILPALGGLACGLVTRFAPETRGGGGDAMITAFHHHGGAIRRRVVWVKPIASLFTLGTGGAGGREGPTMHIGGALGSLIGDLLGVGARERRILLVAGVAAGIAAVFRTPLGAALLAVEILYHDGYESDALVPSILASVVSYSVVISIFGESTLLSHAPRFPFVPAHLPLYGMLAVIVAALAAAFVAALRRSRSFFAGLPGPAWARPAIGGLILGVVCTAMIMIVGVEIGSAGQGLGILGGGYGAVQMAISGAEWLPDQWAAVELLGLLAMVKLLAASITIGSGGSAGDFAPSLAIGGLIGGAFGRAAQLLIADPRIDPGAFALVGMGVFYGGIAHVPLSALVLVCELAGAYDLLVPLMLAQGIAFVALRNTALYEAQVPTQRDSPVHREATVIDVLRGVRVRDRMTCGRPPGTLTAHASASEVLRCANDSHRQDVFPVVDGDGMIGLVSRSAIHRLAADEQPAMWTAREVMQAPVSVHPDDDLRVAAERILANGLREVPVVEEGRVIGLLDEREIARTYVELGHRAIPRAGPGETSWRHLSTRRGPMSQ